MDLRYELSGPRDDLLTRQRPPVANKKESMNHYKISMDVLPDNFKTLCGRDSREDPFSQMRHIPPCELNQDCVKVVVDCPDCQVALSNILTDPTLQSPEA